MLEKKQGKARFKGLNEQLSLFNVWKCNGAVLSTKSVLLHCAGLLLLWLFFCKINTDRKYEFFIWLITLHNHYYISHNTLKQQVPSFCTKSNKSKPKTWNHIHTGSHLSNWIWTNLFINLLQDHLKIMSVSYKMFLCILWTLIDQLQIV